MSSDKIPVDDLRPPLLFQDDGPVQLERLCVDKMLTKYCGEFGYWQFKHFVLTCMVWALNAIHVMVMVFADRELGWFCEPGSTCLRKEEESICDLQPGSWRWDRSEGWSTVAEWGLVCNKKYKVGLVQCLFFGGCMIGNGIFGHLSDSKLGRKGSLTIACIFNSIFGLLTSISPNYPTYVLLRLLTGIGTGGIGLCAFVLATEPIGPTKRGLAGMSTFYFFSAGIAIVSGIAYIFQSWRSLYVASSVPSIIFLVFILPFISESPRWYLIHGRPDLAMNIMHDIAKSNRRHLPKNVCIVLDNEAIATDHDQGITGSLVDVIKFRLTRTRLFLVMGINFTCSIVYYGLSLNVVNLNTNLYVNVLLNAVTEMPAYLLTAILIDRFGRKPLGVGTQWFSGLFCILGSLIMGSRGIWKAVKMACGVLGIFGMAATYNLLYIYTMELFPTVVRNAALGCAGIMSQFGAIVAPVVVVMGGGIPFMVFGACGVLGGIFTLFLSETLHMPLYDTMNGIVDEKDIDMMLS